MQALKKQLRASINAQLSKLTPQQVAAQSLSVTQQLVATDYFQVQPFSCPFVDALAYFALLC
jgi:hypothetical protein